MFEPPAPDPRAGALANQLQDLIDQGKVEVALETFLAAGPGEPPENVEILRRSPLWSTTLALTPTVPLDLRALGSWEFDAGRFRSFSCPVLYLLGTRSPGHFRAIADALVHAVSDFRLTRLPGQGHFANVLASELFATVLGKLPD